jgi:hypothetical protein
MTWTPQKRRAHRSTYARTIAATMPTFNRVVDADVSDDVTVLERDPAPCFRCAVADGCRHRGAY